jgi:hypothetical protein
MSDQAEKFPSGVFRVLSRLHMSVFMFEPDFQGNFVYFYVLSLEFTVHVQIDPALQQGDEIDCAFE